MSIVRGAIALVALVVSFLVISTLPGVNGPSWFAFAALMILPIVAAVAIAPHTSRFAFIAGAIYAALAGTRAMLNFAGNITVEEQLSTAALVTLLVPVLARLWGWIAALRSRVSAKTPETE